MLPERVIAHEELSRGRQLTETEIVVMQAVRALDMKGGKKAARAMRRVLRLLASRPDLAAERDVTSLGWRQPGKAD
jgi:hypothetical protein